MLRFETILSVSRTMSEACLLHSDQLFLVLFQRTDLMDKCLHLVVFLKMEISKRIKVMVYRYDFFSDFGFPQDLRSKRVRFHSSPDLSLPCLPLAYFFFFPLLIFFPLCSLGKASISLELSTEGKPILFCCCPVRFFSSGTNKHAFFLSGVTSVEN